MKFYVYILKCKNTPFYVGKGCGARMYSHYTNAKNSNRPSPVLDKIRKMIKNDERIQYEKVFESDDSSETLNKEIEFISLLVRRNLGSGPLMNLTGGGEGVKDYQWTESHKKHLSDSIKKAIDEGRFIPPNKDKIYTEEEKEHYAKANKKFFETEKGKNWKKELETLGKERLKDGKRVLSENARKKMSEGATRGNIERFKKVL
jgi:hypothetical protein